MKATIIGGGNIGMALAEGLVRSKVCEAAEITITRRNANSLSGLSDKFYKTTTDNAKAVVDAYAICVWVLHTKLCQTDAQIKSFIYCT